MLRVQYLAVHDIFDCLRYLVTYSPPQRKWDQVADSLRVFSVATGALQRAFGSGQLDTSFGWPHLRWSPDDAYFAAANARGLAVYETASFSLLDKKTIKVEDLRDFAFSPSQNVIAYWSSENGEIPAKVALKRFPTKEDLRSKNLFNVASAAITWQESGEHLAVQVERYAKKKGGKKGASANSGPEYSGLTYTVEIFRVRERDVPVDTIEVKEKCLSLGWEPHGNRFAILSSNNPTHKTNVSFYRIGRDGPQLLKVLDQLRNPVNTILWAPAGGWVVLWGGSAGSLFFVDAGSKGEEVSILNDRASHDGATHAAWDPTGRFPRYLPLPLGRTHRGPRLSHLELPGQGALSSAHGPLHAVPLAPSPALRPPGGEGEGGEEEAQVLLRPLRGDRHQAEGQGESRSHGASPGTRLRLRDLADRGARRLRRRGVGATRPPLRSTRPRPLHPPPRSPTPRWRRRASFSRSPAKKLSSNAHRTSDRQAAAPIFCFPTLALTSRPDPFVDHPNSSLRTPIVMLSSSFLSQSPALTGRSHSIFCVRAMMLNLATLIGHHDAVLPVRVRLGTSYYPEFVVFFYHPL